MSASMLCEHCSKEAQFCTQLAPFGTDPGYRIYRLADGWAAVAALEPHFAARFAAAVGDAPETFFASASAADPAAMVALVFLKETAGASLCGTGIPEKTDDIAVSDGAAVSKG